MRLGGDGPFYNNNVDVASLNVQNTFGKYEVFHIFRVGNNFLMASPKGKKMTCSTLTLIENFRRVELSKE